MPDLDRHSSESISAGQAAAGEFYSRFISAIAHEITETREEAEAAVCEILRDIERFAQTGEAPLSRDERLESLIAWRKLLALAGRPGH